MKMSMRKHEPAAESRTEKIKRSVYSGLAGTERSFARAIASYPIAGLGLAMGVGIFLGYLVKRR